MSFVVEDPRGGQERQAPRFAARPASLAGLRLAVLDNGKELADVLLARAATLLAVDGMVPFFDRKPSFSRVAPDEVIERVAVGDLAITGLGG